MLLGAILGAWLWWRGLPQADGPWEVLDQRVSICGEVRSAACVVDGDTLHLGRRRIRLTGFDAPELEGDCAAESALAVRARAELARWLSAAPFQLDGGADPPRDRYGRELRAARRLAAGGALWLDAHMVEAGLARRDDWGGGDGWCDG